MTINTAICRQQISKQTEKFLKLLVTYHRQQRIEWEKQLNPIQQMKSLEKKVDEKIINKAFIEIFSTLSQEERYEVAHEIFLLEEDCRLNTAYGTKQHDSAYLGYLYQARCYYLEPQNFLLLLQNTPNQEAQYYLAERYITANTTSRIDRGDEIDGNIPKDIFIQIFLMTKLDFQKRYAQERLTNPGWHNHEYTNFFENIIKK